jgi:hypothetical protein
LNGEPKILHNRWAITRTRSKVNFRKIGEQIMEENKNQIDTKVSSTLPSYTPLPNDVLIALGFEKVPDGMYYERGWVNKKINIHFEVRPNEKDFWLRIAKEYANRGADQIKQEFRKLLGV